jgi:hypothetical protein
MKLRLSLLVLLLGSQSLLAAGDPPVKGAKEIFFDPTDGSVVSASRGNAFVPPIPPSQSKKSATAPKTGGTAGPRLAQKPKPSQPRPTNQTDLASNQDGSRRPIRAVNGPALGLSYWIELVDKDGQGQQVTGDRIFRSGERIRLHFLSNGDGNIALIQLGSSGTSSVLFPDPAKGLSDGRITAGEDRILPTESAWFRFDKNPGTEKILVLFARAQQEIDNFEIQPRMDAGATQAVIKRVDYVRGGKDLILETETRNASEIGTYGVNLAGKPVVLEIELRHQ